MTRYLLPLLAAAALYAQRPTLNDVDANLKKAADESKAFQRQLLNGQEENSAIQRQMAAKQAAAARANAQQYGDSVLAAFAMQQRLDGVEATLAGMQRDRSLEQADAHQWHRDLVSFGRDVLAGLALAVVLAIFSLFRDGQRNRAERRGRENAERAASESSQAAAKLDKKTDLIHSLVNSNMTAAMEGEKNALECSVTALKEIAQLLKKKGEQPTVEANAALQAQEQRIAQLKAQLKDRQHATPKVSPKK